MWNLPVPGLKPVFPASAGGFLTTAPPGKSYNLLRIVVNQWMLRVCGVGLAAIILLEQNSVLDFVSCVSLLTLRIFGVYFVNLHTRRMASPFRTQTTFTLHLYHLSSGASWAKCVNILILGLRTIDLFLLRKLNNWKKVKT